MDLHEAIQDGDLSSLDNSDFRDTDIPFEVPLPETTYLTDAEHDDIKDWVLTVSMDAKVIDVRRDCTHSPFSLALSADPEITTPLSLYSL